MCKEGLSLLLPLLLLPVFLAHPQSSTKNSMTKPQTPLSFIMIVFNNLFALIKVAAAALGHAALFP